MDFPGAGVSRRRLARPNAHIDRDDLCPTVAGIAAFSGCPDTDSDGITDASDECPTVAGVDRYKGCPIPDTDKDGVNDEVDKCLTVAGTAKYMGCSCGIHK